MNALRICLLFKGSHLDPQEHQTNRHKQQHESAQKPPWFTRMSH